MASAFVPNLNYLSAGADWSVAALAFLLVGLVRADEKKPVETKLHPQHAWFVSADQRAKPPTITFKVKYKGKEKQLTLPLAKQARIYGEKYDPETLAKFVSHLAKEKDKAILVVEDKAGKHIVELTDLPRSK